MLTDEEALKLIERVRRHTPSIEVVELCDWGLQQITGRAALGRVMSGTTVLAPDLGPSLVQPVRPAGRKETPADRKAYMRDYMAKRRKGKASEPRA